MYHSLSIYLLNRILVASEFWQLWTKLLQTFVCRLLCGHKTSVHLGKYHEAQLHNCLVRLYLVFFFKHLQTVFQSGCIILYSCCCLVVNSCLTLCDPIDCSLPGPSVHEISHARILKCIAISFSRGSSWPRNRTRVSCISRWILYHWVIRTACFVFLPRVHESSFYTRFLPAFYAANVLDFSPSDGCVVLCYCFNLQLPEDIWCWTYFHVLFSICISFLVRLPDFFPILMGCLFSYCWILRVLCIVRM